MSAIAAIAALLFQAAPPPPAPQPYAAPPIRPFEPTGPLETAQGGETTAPIRAPLDAPSSVDVYAGQYEATPSDAHVAYAQGVTSAELVMDSRMGALDGRWRVVDEAGTELFALVLSDPGGDAPIEGAWRDGRGRMGVAASTDRSILVLDGSCELHLAPDGRSGVIVRDGRRTPVRLSR